LLVPIGGDLITAVDGKPITSLTELQTLLVQTQSGDVLTLTILRDGQELLIDATLG
jgi:S1-C subfamily serine protease